MATENQKRCAYCGVVVTPHTGRGRPALYCHPSCRRAMADSLRRARRAVEHLDVEVMRVERVVRAIDSGNVEYARERLQKLRAYRADLEREQWQLLRRPEAELAQDKALPVQPSAAVP